MQLIEVSEIGVRAAIVRLESAKANLVWLMLPMIHLGERSYYRQVEERMKACDLVLAEGIDSRIVDALTSSYRLAGTNASGVVAQSSQRPATGHMVVQPSDISGAEFDAEWRKMPVGLRLGLPLLAPLFGAWLRFVANPAQWQHMLQTDDLPSNDEVVLEGQFPELFHLLLHNRNAHLFHQIEEVQRNYADLHKVVGVAWGAKHIGAVVAYLIDRWGYVARSAEWVTVFDYTH